MGRLNFFQGASAFSAWCEWILQEIKKSSIMFVTVTSLRLKSLWGFLRLSWLALKITRQLKAEKGFIKMRSKGFGKLHFTLTQWQTEEDLKRFAQTGEHLIAMKESAKLASTIITYTYPSDSFPDWNARSY